MTEGIVTLNVVKGLLALADLFFTANIIISRRFLVTHVPRNDKRADNICPYIVFLILRGCLGAVPLITITGWRQRSAALCRWSYSHRCQPWRHGDADSVPGTSVRAAAASQSAAVLVPFAAKRHALKCKYKGDSSSLCSSEWHCGRTLIAPALRFWALLAAKVPGARFLHAKTPLI